MPWTPNTTWVDGSGGGTPLSAARLNNMEAGVAWTYDAHTLVITAGGGSPTVGNGTVVARYCQRGKFVHYFGKLTLGTTTSFGTSGATLFSLPAPALGSLGARGEARILDASTGFQWFGHTQPGGSTFSFEYLSAFGAAGANVSFAQPFTWTTSDVIEWNIVYEAA